MAADKGYSFKELCSLTNFEVAVVPDVLGLDIAADSREDADEQQPAHHPAASCQPAE